MGVIERRKGVWEWLGVRKYRSEWMTKWVAWEGGNVVRKTLKYAEVEVQLEGCYMKGRGPNDSIPGQKSHGKCDISHTISMEVLGRRAVCSNASPWLTEETQPSDNGSHQTLQRSSEDTVFLLLCRSCVSLCGSSCPSCAWWSSITSFGLCSSCALWMWLQNNAGHI